ncbi:MAG: IPT/TIG domain-containing protein, partial [Chitinophagaceae bacterium]|nr:IPT/TIG domain-containing protein [Chitinophagaceae bacterium]
SALVFRVPDTAFGGVLKIIFTNSAGKSLSVPFKVIALPSVITAFPSDFISGSEVTITGSNLDDVTKVLLDGTTDEATIVSQTRKQMVVKMPTTTVDRAKLRVTNLSGERVSDFEMVNVAKAITVFSEQLDNSFENWGWGGTYEASTEGVITGTKGLKAAFDPAGSWGGLQLGAGKVTLSGHKYFTFWAKGADVDKNVQFWLNWGGQKVITIPANKWTYFRFELATGWPGVTNVDNVTFQMQDAGKTVYFDNIMFIK